MHELNGDKPAELMWLLGGAALLIFVWLIVAGLARDLEPAGRQIEGLIAV